MFSNKEDILKFFDLDNSAAPFDGKALFLYRTGLRQICGF